MDARNVLDEFAEFQLKDIPVRQALGGFCRPTAWVPPLTVRPLEGLRAQNRGHIFDPDCLTEDHETGLRVFAAGYRQIFVPVRLEKKRAGSNARVLPTPLVCRHPAAQQVGCGNRTARLGAPRLVLDQAAALLVLARSQRPGC